MNNFMESFIDAGITIAMIFFLGNMVVTLIGVLLNLINAHMDRKSKKYSNRAHQLEQEIHALNAGLELLNQITLHSEIQTFRIKNKYYGKGELGFVFEYKGQEQTIPVTKEQYDTHSIGSEISIRMNITEYHIEGKDDTITWLLEET